MKKLLTLFFLLVLNTAGYCQNVWPPCCFNLTHATDYSTWNLAWDNQIGASDSVRFGNVWVHLQTPVTQADSLVLHAYYVSQGGYPYTYTFAFTRTMAGNESSTTFGRDSICEHEIDWGIDAWSGGSISHRLYTAVYPSLDTLSFFQLASATWGCPASTGGNLPPAPTNVTLDRGTLSWSAVTGATSYNIYVSMNHKFQEEVVGRHASGRLFRSTVGTSMRVPSPPNNLFTFSVSAVNSTGESSPTPNQ